MTRRSGSTLFLTLLLAIGVLVSAAGVAAGQEEDPLVLHPPEDLVLGCYADTSPTDPEVSGGCGDVTLTYQDEVTGDDDDCPMDYAITRTWTATDGCGTTATHEQTIVVGCPCGTVEVTKYTNGVLNDTEDSMDWLFELTGPGIGVVSDASPPALVDFGFVALWPSDDGYNNVYTLCEVGIFAGWTTEWRGSPNPDALTTGGDAPETVIPQVSEVNDDPVVNPPGYSSVFDPNYVDPPGTFVNDTRCVSFVVLSDEVEVFAIDNQSPDGGPRTIGYWKNWNTCSNGNQAETAATLGGSDAGVYLLDDVLNDPGIVIGLLELGGDDCEAAHAILDKRDVDSGRKRASDAAYGLASQVLAALANLSATATTCASATGAVVEAQDLLESISFEGTGSYLRSRHPLYGPAVSLAHVLDSYNSGVLCDE